MIDQDGYRANVAVVIINKEGKVFWARRIRQKAWQFPQGGVHKGEQAIAAMYRELYEEVGLLPEHVEILAVTKSWLKYKLPEHLVRSSEPKCIGQKQKWFLLKMLADDTAVQLDVNKKPEFDGWRWVDYWSPMGQVVSFKRHVYRRALEFFHPLVQSLVGKQ